MVFSWEKIVILYFLLGIVLFFYFIFSYMILLLGIEFIMITIFVGVTTKAFNVGASVDLMFLFICMIVLEGVIGLCLLLKTYRYRGRSINYRW